MFLLRRNLANFKQTFVLVGRSTYKRWTTQSSSDTLRRASTIAVESDAHHDLSVKSDGKILSLENNHYHVDWLRHNCQCPRCRDSFAGQRKVQLSDLEDLTITSAQMKGEYNNIICLQCSFSMNRPTCLGVFMIVTV